MKKKYVCKKVQRILFVEIFSKGISQIGSSEFVVIMAAAAAANFEVYSSPDVEE